MTTNLSLGNWSDPAQGHVDGDGDDTDDPEDLRIVVAVVTEDDGEDDASKIANSTGAATDDTVGIGMHVWDEGEVGTVAGFEEEGHAGDETEHIVVCLRVGETDGNLESTSDDR